MNKEYIFNQATKYVLQKKPKHLQNKITTDYNDCVINFLKNPVNLIEVFLNVNFKTPEQLQGLSEYNEYLYQEQLRPPKEVVKKLEIVEAPLLKLVKKNVRKYIIKLN